MRCIIAILVILCCYSLSLHAGKDKSVRIKPLAEKKLSNFCKKKKSSLKNEHFSKEISCLHGNCQHHAAISQNIGRLIDTPTINDSLALSTTINTTFYYHFTLQHLYPKHSFW